MTCLSEPAVEVLQSLEAYPSRSTASGIANSPHLVNSLDPAAAHDALTALADRGQSPRALEPDPPGPWLTSGPDS